MWNKVEHDFGRIKSGSIQTTSFTYSGGKEVQTIEPLCNCISARLVNNILNVTWKTKPNVVREYESNKVIMIIYRDESIDDLTVKGIIEP